MPSYQPVHEDYIREQTGLDCLTREEYADKKMTILTIMRM